MVITREMEKLIASRSSELQAEGVSKRDAEDRAYFEVVIPDANPDEIARDLEDHRKRPFVWG